MPRYDVILLTESRYLQPKGSSDYEMNILKEDAIISDALTSKGFKVERKDWNDTDFDWSDTRAALFRTTWDYFFKIDLFLDWLDKTSATTTLINPPELIKWNADKSYLGDLSRKGIRTVPTRFLHRGSAMSIEQFQNLTGWHDVVIKPTVGGAGRLTYRIDLNNSSEVFSQIQGYLMKEDFMIQPFQYSVPVNGEWSFIFIGGEYSHAVLKKAKAGDFRVQDDYGGTVHEYMAGSEPIEFAKSALSGCPVEPVYARVDVILDNEGNYAVSELELIEPELWFRRNPASADRLADEIIQLL